MLRFDLQIKNEEIKEKYPEIVTYSGRILKKFLG